MSRLGFTLIELLIVITIIGILAVVFLPNILGAPAKARDATRQADIGNIVEAIEASRLDSVALPVAGCVDTVLPVGTYAKYFGGGQIPKDPGGLGVGTGCAAGYYLKIYPASSSVKYGVFAQVENYKNGNVACSIAMEDGVPPLSKMTVAPVAPALPCYGAVSQ